MPPFLGHHVTSLVVISHGHSIGGMAKLPPYSFPPYRSMSETTTATRELSLSYGEFLINFPLRPHTDCFPECCYKPPVGFTAAGQSTYPYRKYLCINHNFHIRFVLYRCEPWWRGVVEQYSRGGCYQCQKRWRRDVADFEECELTMFILNNKIPCSLLPILFTAATKFPLR